MTILKKDRILSVDDTEDNLILVEAILEDEGYHIDSVANGEASLKNVVELPPDLIILDVMIG